MPAKNFASRIFLMFLFLTSAPLLAQYNTDSLKANINNPKLHDTTKLANIALLIDNLFENKAANVYTDLMGKIARRNLASKNLSTELRKKYTMYLAAYYNNVSIQLENNQNPKALDYLNKSVELYRSVGADDELYTSLVSKGLLLSRRKRYKEAIECYFKALKFFEKDKEANADGISYVYTNLGVLYGDQDQNLTSIKYLKKAVENIDRKKEAPTVEDGLQKSLIYYNIGTKYFILKNFTLADKYLHLSLELSEKYNQNSFRSFAIGRLGTIDLHFKRYEAAEKKLIFAKELSESNDAKAFALINLGDVYLHKKEYAKAEKCLEQGLAISKNLHNVDLNGHAYYSLYQVCKENGNYRKGIEMLEAYNTIQDSTKVEETKNELKRQQLQYSFEKKALNLELETQRKNAAKNNLLLLLTSAVILLFIGAYFFYRNAKQKQAISAFEKNSLRQKLLLSQMNPHFIFNSIDNIQSLIYNKQDKEAVDYLAKFSKLTRQILENSNENYITLDEELMMIDNYLSIQRLLYGNKFNFVVNLADAIDTELILVPPMLTQPFIENAIKHGLAGRDNGLIAIDFNFENQKLLFTISDNGVGFGESNHSDGKKSLAMKITKERLRSLTGKSDFEIRLQNLFDDHSQIVGAQVSFEIPYIYEN
ncbi:tetratricopeptide repeat protein [Flavobacterium sp. CYK-4]|uniref:tetratricopeptide repeat-containing sensor histidine kinase n=1 Tax=Flavobacterium lotistagni TaxID=2709660 RepID=UPI00140B145F|nr:histidine kinase [Flavobacterium lotistagni]NHM06241.1 tetratricopeptide repeat protein [Flavobacterium lotistagni]